MEVFFLGGIVILLYMYNVYWFSFKYEKNTIDRKWFENKSRNDLIKFICIKIFEII